MKSKLSLGIALAFALAAPLRADSLTESMQQKLKEQGFYYGGINGTKDADTTAALRRYQIRNGLKISGELDAETQQSLGLSGSAATARATTPVATPAPARSYVANDAPRISEPAPSRVLPAEEVPPRPPSLRVTTREIFLGTPFENAPPDLQRRVVVGAQVVLMRGGFYRGAIDGAYGPAMQFSLRAYQSRSGLERSGMLDEETLGALGLLPGQERSQLERPRQRVVQPRWEIGPTGERIYLPQ